MVNSRKVVFLIAILLISAIIIAATGCTQKQIPAENNQITVSGNTTTSLAKTKAPTLASSPIPTPLPIITPTPPQPTPVPPIPLPPTPTPLPKPQCNHVEIIIFHPYGVPCNNCAAMSGVLTQYYANNPYVTISVQNATENSVVGIVKETGQAQGFAWAYTGPIEAWTDSVLTCK